MNEQLREKIAAILSRSVLVIHTVYGEKEYYSLYLRLDQILLPIEEEREREQQEDIEERERDSF